MALVFALILLIYAFVGEMYEQGNRSLKIKARNEKKSGGGKFIDGWEEYVIHCKNVAKVREDIEEAKKTLNADEYTSDWGLEQAATRIVSQKTFGVPYKSWKQIAYYYTCLDVLRKGKRTARMWGTPVSPAESNEEEFKKEFINDSFKCSEWSGPNSRGIGYPIHDKPDMSIRNKFFTTHFQPSCAYAAFDIDEWTKEWKRTH